jgi:hypothetical protein
MLVEIRGGAKVEIPNRDEIRGELADVLDVRERSRARGVKWLDIVQPVTPATGIITVGPDQGYVWSVKVVSTTLASAGTLAVYKVTGWTGDSTTTNDTRRLVGYNSTSQTQQVITWGSNQCFLQAGWGLLLVGGQNIPSYYMGVEEAVSEQQWKVFS